MWATSTSTARPPAGRATDVASWRWIVQSLLMVLTKSELIAAAKDEIRILVHLAGKVQPTMLDYRPTPKQRSTLELLRYMAIMGPTQLAVIEKGVFDRLTLSATWSPAEA